MGAGVAAGRGQGCRSGSGDGDGLRVTMKMKREPGSGGGEPTGIVDRAVEVSQIGAEQRGPAAYGKGEGQARPLPPVPEHCLESCSGDSGSGASLGCPLPGVLTAPHDSAGQAGRGALTWLV